DLDHGLRGREEAEQAVALDAEVAEVERHHREGDQRVGEGVADRGDEVASGQCAQTTYAICKRRLRKRAKRYTPCPMDALDPRLPVARPLPGPGPVPAWMVRLLRSLADGRDARLAAVLVAADAGPGRGLRPSRAILRAYERVDARLRPANPEHDEFVPLPPDL